MNILRFIIYRSPIFILLVIILPIIAGMFAYSTLPKEGEPEISAPIAIVVTLYQGASPLEIENLVTTPIEEALSDLKDVDEIRSTSAESVSIVVIDFEVEADLEASLQRVREKVTDARKDLPDEAEDPEVNEVSFSDIPIMIASIIGDIDPVKLRRLTEDVAQAYPNDDTHLQESELGQAPPDRGCDAAWTQYRGAGRRSKRPRALRDLS